MGTHIPATVQPTSCWEKFTVYSKMFISDRQLNICHLGVHRVHQKSSPLQSLADNVVANGN